MKPLRVILVDDEALARMRLRRLLEDAPEVEIVAECSGGNAALESLRSLRPHLVFLDVQMPDRDGFEVLEMLAPEDLPIVVFVTAYDEYALRAFDVHAVDYLLKPFDDERFAVALSRARARLQRMDDERDNLRSLLARVRGGGANPSPADASRLVVRSAGRVALLEVEKIDWIEARGSYVRLHLANDTHLVRESLSAMSSRLPEDQFLRIHRSFVVNLRQIRELERGHGDTCRVVLEGGTRLEVSRRHREKLRRTLGL